MWDRAFVFDSTFDEENALSLYESDGAKNDDFPTTTFYHIIRDFCSLSLSKKRTDQLHA